MEVLARLGIEHVVISPGSRSTPLTLAAAKNPKLETLVILDERTAGFIALGIAKRSRKPVALVCTSGTAAANYHPAVIEASLSGTPLLVLTADRPPELRDCSAGQTIDQIKLFGSSVRLFAEMSLPELLPERLAYLRQSLVHAVDRAVQIHPGPVHLNFPFREPLLALTNAEPVVDANSLEQAATVVTRVTEAVSIGGALDTVAIERLSSHRKGIIVVGDINPRGGDVEFATAVALLSQKLGWPVLADVLNPLRGHADELSGLVCHYDRHLRAATDAVELKPTAVLQIGALPTSKVLRTWLQKIDATHFLLVDRPFNSDPLHRIATVLHGDVSGLADQIKPLHGDSEWLSAWTHLEARATADVNARLEPLESLFEGKAAWLLSQQVPAGSSVFLASSMSVRYAEWFWCVGSPAGSIYANRGANGIDGTLGTAVGVAHRGSPTILLTGDLAFLHDTNALLAAKDLRGSLTVVLINNNGGGIFEHLPVANVDCFEDHFAAPQEVNLQTLCAAYGVTYKCIQDWDTYTAELKDPSGGLRVLELKTDRKADSEFLKTV